MPTLQLSNSLIFNRFLNDHDRTPSPIPKWDRPFLPPTKETGFFRSLLSLNQYLVQKTRFLNFRRSYFFDFSQKCDRIF